MILRILFLTCAIFASPSFGLLSFEKFTRDFEDMCFQNDASDPFRVNGQDTPLSNTLESFIALAEKLEAANPGLTLREELTYLISDYVFENIKLLNGRVNQWHVGRASFEHIDRMWDPDDNGYNPYIDVPFTDSEKCSLYYMISHSILEKDYLLIPPDSPGNFSSNPKRAARQDLNPDDYYPQELGVVAVRGTDSAVSLSKVLIGLFVGLKENRMSDLLSYDRVVKMSTHEQEELPEDAVVDALYSVTMADVLMRSQWTGSDRPGIAANGKWVSIPISSEKKMDGFCPMVYLQESGNGSLPAYSYSSIRGAADGLILGLAVQQVYMKKFNTKLSQLLRMYYSPDGIPLDLPVEDINSNHISFCNRQGVIELLESKIQDQMKLYGYLIAQTLKDVKDGYEKSKNLYATEKQLIFQNSNSELKDYCNRPHSLKKPEDLPRETFLDVIVVMDSSSSKNSFEEQQMIVGYLANYLDLRYTGSQMTILSGHRLYGSSSKIELKPIVYDTYSSSCAACVLGQTDFEPSTVAREEVIGGIDQFLRERKENETKLYGARGKVVVFFDFDYDGTNKIQGSLEKALRDLHLRHKDTVFTAVGLDLELLKKYAKNDPSLVVLATEGRLDEIAKALYQTISFAPALLQYSECTDKKAEKIISYESMASPYTVQHYSMPAEYFYKSQKLSFKFESMSGNIRICHSRITAKPEDAAKICKNTTRNNFAEFQITNPCKGFTKESCAPLYFSVMGMDENESERKEYHRVKYYCNDLNDKWCSTLDQIYFRVFHTGVRCSGCLGLGASPVVILLTVLLSYVTFRIKWD